jgi:hypothetical protein
MWAFSGLAHGALAALRYLVDESVERDQDLLDSGLGVIQLIHGGLLTLYPTPAKHRLRRFGSMKMTDRDSDTLDPIGRAMMKAWSRVKRPKRKEWSEWMVIDEGLLEGRRWAMQAANVNRPEGKGYGTAFKSGSGATRSTTWTSPTAPSCCG